MARAKAPKVASNINPIAVYVPLDWQHAPLRDKAQTLLLTGSAGGGKSVLALQKLHAFCLHYPGAMGLLLRKVKASMTNSTVLTFERYIVGDDPGVTHVPSKARFEYANGSVVAYAGMEDEQARQRIKSIGEQGGVDIAVMEEGTEFQEADYNMLISRMRGTAVERYLFCLAMAKHAKPTPQQRKAAYASARANGWQQIIIPTNPDSPQHWIYTRLIQNSEASVYYSKADDNPHNPETYQDSLGRLTGIDGDRLRDGLWLMASGLIYDTFDLERSVTTDAEYMPGAGAVLWAVDDGYSGQIDPITKLYTGSSHPRVFLLIQQRPDGSLCVFAEHHAIHKLSDIHIAEVLELPYPMPDFAVVDKSAAELKGRLFSAGIYTRNSPSSVEESIKVLRGALAPDANGWRKITIHPRCKLLISEFAHYSRDSRTGNPIKEFDHGLDALRYLAFRTRE